MKTAFILAKNDCFENQKFILNIIVKEPKDRPYLSVTLQSNGHLVGNSWMEDKDLEMFAVNILKALKSKKLNQVQ